MQFIAAGSFLAKLLAHSWALESVAAEGFRRNAFSEQFPANSRFKRCDWKALQFGYYISFVVLKLNEPFGLRRMLLSGKSGWRSG